MGRLAEQGVDLFLVYGDPAYYGRFGFQAETAARFVSPYPLRYPSGWLAFQRSQAGAGEPRHRLSCVQALQDPALW